LWVWIYLGVPDILYLFPSTNTTDSIVFWALRIIKIDTLSLDRPVSVDIIFTVRLELEGLIEMKLGYLY
jgi:hypothetical protein